jgi:hypothetical protein
VTSLKKVVMFVVQFEPSSFRLIASSTSAEVKGGKRIGFALAPQTCLCANQICEEERTVRGTEEKKEEHDAPTSDAPDRRGTSRSHVRRRKSTAGSSRRRRRRRDR